MPTSSVSNSKLDQKPMNKLSKLVKSSKAKFADDDSDIDMEDEEIFAVKRSPKPIRQRKVVNYVTDLGLDDEEEDIDDDDEFDE